MQACRALRCLPALFAAALLLVIGRPGSSQPTSPPRADRLAPASPNALTGEAYTGGSTAMKLLATPLSRLIPGNVPPPPPLRNPVGQSAEATQRGMRYFVGFNCIGCHADNGGGGMGPALSNNTFIYGSEPANIYLSIHQGRPNGMPAWAAVLPDNIIWDLVAYIGSISKEPATGWGKTISAETLNVEQVPTEYLQALSPWEHTETFGHGQKPNRAR